MYLDLNLVFLVGVPIAIALLAWQRASVWKARCQEWRRIDDNIVLEKKPLPINIVEDATVPPDQVVLYNDMGIEVGKITNVDTETKT